MIPIVGNSTLHTALMCAAGADDGVFRGQGEAGAVVPETPNSLYVVVGGFSGIAGGHPVTCSGGRLGPVAVPTGGSAGDLRRVDLVQFTYGRGLNIKAGSESGSPAAPTPDADSIVLAKLNCRTGMSSVKATDDSANGYIVDFRQFI